MSNPQTWTVEYLDVVADWVRGLAEKDRARVLWTVGLLQTYGTQLGVKYSRQVRGKIFELRVAAGRRDYRLLYFARVGRRFVMLHAFAKSTSKTPARDIAAAERRMADYLAAHRRIEYEDYHP